MKSKELEQILARTNGTLHYIEQFHEINSNLLKLETKEIEEMYMAYAKKSKQVDKFNEMILTKIEDSHFADELILMFTMQVPYIQSEFIIKLQEKNQNMVIDSILSSTEGKLKYYYQAFMILTDVVGFTEFQAQGIISNYKKPQPHTAQRKPTLLLENINSLEMTSPLKK